MDIEVAPEGSLEVLSQLEVNALRNQGEGGLYPLLRRCALAVLTSGSMTDDAGELLRAYEDFDITILETDRGVRLALQGAPEMAFVDGQMIRGTRELLFAVLRDIVFFHTEFAGTERFDFSKSEHLTNVVFHVLRHADVVQARRNVDVVVCWGGHAISRNEYDYTKQVGYELGLRHLQICTGCGPGAMKGPMKGATIGHSKQRVRDGRYIGLTEPGIIAAESPNPIVNELVILPDMEKRLEAFVRVGHAIVVFPGGVGTAEEILYLLGILLHPENAGNPVPLVLTGPAGSADYFAKIDRFIKATLGEAAASLYDIVVDDPVRVAQIVQDGLDRVEMRRRRDGDAFYFNWRLHIEAEFQRPFVATHESMASLNLSEDLPPHLLAANLRRAFSGIVSGNIREETVAMVEAEGPFELRGSPRVAELLDELLRDFVAQRRMKISSDYRPCFRVITHPL
ncbi:MAG: nucleotide 5'-monophosphate nucleosidase PpnN [Pseudomonadota bacterium]